MNDNLIILLFQMQYYKQSSNFLGTYPSEAGDAAAIQLPVLVRAVKKTNWGVLKILSFFAQRSILTDRQGFSQDKQ